LALDVCQAILKMLMFGKSKDLTEIARIYGGLAFLGALPGSPAEAVLERGDVVVAVNGIPTPDVVSFLKARQARTGGASVRYIRAGVEREAELVWGVPD
jgi:S1-C subfamily serine protease